jgi:hypothetical protein
LFNFHTTEYICETSKTSSNQSGGKTLFRALLSIVFPLPGAQTISKLCKPAAAIDKALFAKICHLIYSKSISKSNLISYSFSTSLDSEIQFKSFQSTKYPTN